SRLTSKHLPKSLQNISESGKGKSSSGCSPPNIFSLDKRLNDSLADIDTKFENLSKIIELGKSNTNDKTERIEKWLNRMEQFLSSLDNQLNSQTHPKNKHFEPKDIKQPQKVEESKFMITDLCSRYLPRVWTIAEPVPYNLRNDQKIEKIVQIVQRVSRWDDENSNFQKNSADYPLYL
ncbi:hypothetical protein OnM2_073032, partial [Erysiphe neolycopersici]